MLSSRSASSASWEMAQEDGIEFTRAMSSMRPVTFAACRAASTVSVGRHDTRTHDVRNDAFEHFHLLGPLKKHHIYTGFVVMFQDSIISRTVGSARQHDGLTAIAAATGVGGVVAHADPLERSARAYDL